MDVDVGGVMMGEYGQQGSECIFLCMIMGCWGRPRKTKKIKSQLICQSPYRSKEIVRDKCLEISLLNKVKSYKVRNIEAGREF